MLQKAIKPALPAVQRYHADWHNFQHLAPAIWRDGAVSQKSSRKELCFGVTEMVSLAEERWSAHCGYLLCLSIKTKLPAWHPLLAGCDQSLLGCEGNGSV